MNVQEDEQNKFSVINKVDKFGYAILYHGNILNEKDWKTLVVPISAIKHIKSSSPGYDKIEIIWNDDTDYNIDLVNKIEFK